MENHILPYCRHHRIVFHQRGMELFKSFFPGFPSVNAVSFNAIRWAEGSFRPPRRFKPTAKEIERMPSTLDVDFVNISREWSKEADSLS